MESAVKAPIRQILLEAGRFGKQEHMLITSRFIGGQVRACILATDDTPRIGYSPAWRTQVSGMVSAQDVDHAITIPGAPVAQCLGRPLSSSCTPASSCWSSPRTMRAGSLATCTSGWISAFSMYSPLASRKPTSGMPK